MSLWRVASTTAVMVAVGACAATVVGFATAQPRDRPGKLAALPATSMPRPTVLAPTPDTPGPPATSATPVATTPKATPTSTRSGSAPHRSTPRPAPKPVPSSTNAARPPRTNAARPPRTNSPPLPRGRALPLAYGTGAATRVVTVVAGSTSSTTATVQAWARAAGGGWLRHGSAMPAHIGSQGLTSHPSESRAATPIGSFTLTQAFGNAADPGTRLPYFRTDASDWWVSDTTSRYYNRHYRCSGSCPFDTSAGENLRDAGYVYDYAVVIDYNRFPVTRGAGSAFFLHVTNGAATAGCVAVSRARLVSLMRWLAPGAHPRILIGVA